MAFSCFLKKEQEIILIDKSYRVCFYVGSLNSIQTRKAFVPPTQRATSFHRCGVLIVGAKLQHTPMLKDFLSNHFMASINLTDNILK